VPSVEDIVGMLLERKQAQSPLLHNMARLRDAYNGDIVVPLPEMDRQEQAAVAKFCDSITPFTFPILVLARSFEPT
jgi:hypothetical protein